MDPNFQRAHAKRGGGGRGRGRGRGKGGGKGSSTSEGKAVAGNKGKASSKGRGRGHAGRRGKAGGRGRGRANPTRASLMAAGITPGKGSTFGAGYRGHACSSEAASSATSCQDPKSAGSSSRKRNNSAGGAKPKQDPKRQRAVETVSLEYKPPVGMPKAALPQAERAWLPLVGKCTQQSAYRLSCNIPPGVCRLCSLCTVRPNRTC